MSDPTSVAQAKREVRQRLREIRRTTSFEADRSARVVRGVVDQIVEHDARVVMAYHAVAGEPDLSTLFDWGPSHGRKVVAPAATPSATFPVQPTEPDLIVVPALALTRLGTRLGQGGGWYDRFLAGRRADCLVVGVCFVEFIVDDLPVDTHDVPVNVVVTDQSRMTRRPDAV